MLHIHVLLVAPLGAAHKYAGRVSNRQSSHHPGAAADLPVEPLNNIVGADPGSVLGENPQ